jgi:hypothetical protein
MRLNLQSNRMNFWFSKAVLRVLTSASEIISTLILMYVLSLALSLGSSLPPLMSLRLTISRSLSACFFFSLFPCLLVSITYGTSSFPPRTCRAGRGGGLTAQHQATARALPPPRDARDAKDPLPLRGAEREGHLRRLGRVRDDGLDRVLEALLPGEMHSFTS